MMNFILWVVYLILTLIGMHYNMYVNLISYHIIASIVALIMCGVDKNKAINNKWRIPEKKLFLVSLIGGALGMWVGMAWFRHKTKHIFFMLGIPAIALVNGFILFFYFYRL